MTHYLVKCKRSKHQKFDIFNTTTTVSF